MSKTVDAYRRAAVRLWKLTPEEAAVGIVHPDDDRGQWAPGSLAVIYMEGQTPLDYWGNGHELAIQLAEMAGVGFIEFINPAVAAVYPD